MGNVKKKILLLSTGDVNGAYEAIYRLSCLFIEEGNEVVMLVKYKTRVKDFIIQYQPLKNYKSKVGIFDRLINKIKKRFFQSKKRVENKISFDPNYNFISVDETSTNVSSSKIIEQIGFIPDYIYSGMTNDFMNSTDLLNLQILTNSHIYNVSVDMNHFTGGCHFAWDCKGYITGCDSKCPAILSEVGRELAKINFQTKLENARKGNFEIIGMSDWTVRQSKQSKIYSDQNIVYNINSIIDTKILHNRNRSYAKEIFNLNPDKFYVLMGCQNSNDKRKGFEYLVEALNILENNISTEQKDRIEILIVSRQISQSFHNIPFKKANIDYINDYRLLTLLYQAADVFVNSSIEDSGPMMVSEALACGTPVVGFDMGVVNNMVINNYNGYKAELKNSADLALGVQNILYLSEDEYAKYSLNAVKQVEVFSSFDAIKELNLNK